MTNFITILVFMFFVWLTLKITSKIFRIIVFVIIISSLFSLYGCSPKEEIKLKEETFKVEYGMNVSNDPKDYLDNSEELLQSVIIENIPEKETNKDFPPVGSYEILIKDQKEKKKVDILIEDTTKPIFKNLKQTYELEYGIKLNSQLFEADDLSKVKITIDDSKVDYKKSGEYEVQVIAKDEAGNETIEKVRVVVKEEVKKEEIQPKKDKTADIQNQNTNKPNKKQNTDKTEENNLNTNKGNITNKENNTNDKQTATHKHNFSYPTGYDSLFIYEKKYFKTLKEIDDFVLSGTYWGENNDWASFQYSSDECSCGLNRLYFFNISYIE